MCDSGLAGMLIVDECADCGIGRPVWLGSPHVCSGRGVDFVDRDLAMEVALSQISRWASVLAILADR